MTVLLEQSVPSDSFLEWAFLRWVLGPAALPSIIHHLVPQQRVEVDGHTYRVDYELVGDHRIAIELDGFEFHSSRNAFTYDRLRQNDLASTGRHVIRFTYDSIRTDTARCVAQIQAVMAADAGLAAHINPDPQVETPDMDPDSVAGLAPPPRPPGEQPAIATYFDEVRSKLNRGTLRMCQREAFSALGNYYGGGGTHAACVMSVGAGKTVLGVAAALAFTRQRALIVTPGSVIRGTFDRALDHTAVGNALYGLPDGPLIPGCRPPAVRTLDRADGSIRGVTREQLLAADIIVTNFHSLGTGQDSDDLLAKLGPDDIDLIVVDEAHIAASDSYRRLFERFTASKNLLMSACFQRLDGKPIDADVVYRYRLIDSIAEGHAKNLRVHRFAPRDEVTTYELVWPDGLREEIVGREQLLEIITAERKLARITAKSDEPIRQVMRVVRTRLDAQAAILHPVRPRVLFSAMGERHAEQIARIANEHGIAAATLHHSQPDAQIRRTRERFESEAGGLDAIVQLKMLGQGYDFPPISIVAPMRPYGSFGEFYQFIGRGIRVITHPALTGRVEPADQFLDVVYHAELGLDAHLETIYLENDMDPAPLQDLPDAADPAPGDPDAPPGTNGTNTASRPDAFVLFEEGVTTPHTVHDQVRIDARRAEREQAALAQRYAEYAASSPTPVSFQQFTEVIRQLHD